MCLSNLPGNHSHRIAELENRSASKGLPLNRRETVTIAKSDPAIHVARYISILISRTECASHSAGQDRGSLEALERSSERRSIRCTRDLEWSGRIGPARESTRSLGSFSSPARNILSTNCTEIMDVLWGGTVAPSEFENSMPRGCKSRIKMHALSTRHEPRPPAVDQNRFALKTSREARARKSRIPGIIPSNEN